MIRNQGQLEQTRREIEHLKERLVGLENKVLSKEMRRLQEAGLGRMMRDLEFQVRAYEDAERGRVRPSVLKRLLTPAGPSDRPRIGEAMFLLRTARNMTQEELARKIVTRREVVARWERDDYRSYTLENLRKIFQALGCRLGLLIRMAG